MNPLRGGWVVLMSLLVAMLLAVFHLPESWPDWLGWWRPSWMLLVLFFWVMELPERIGLVASWVLGVLVDALLSQPLGLNGFLFAATTYIAWRFFERLRMYSIVQQCGVIFLTILAAEIARSLVMDLDRNYALSWTVLFIALASALIWPLLYVFLLRIKLLARVE